MVKGYLTNKREFKNHIDENAKMHQLNVCDWQNARGFNDVLEPLYEATILEAGENYLTLGTWIPVLHIVRKRLLDYINDKNNVGYGITFARNVLAALEDRFGSYPSFLELLPHSLATICDPRFKQVYFSKRPEIERAKATVIDHLKEEMEVSLF